MTEEEKILGQILQTLKRIEKGSGGSLSGGSGSGGGGVFGAGMDEKDVQRQQQAVKDEIAQFDARVANGEKIAAQEKARIKILRELDEAGKNVSDPEQWDRLSTSFRGLGNEMEAGASKAEDLVQALMPVDGAFKSLAQKIPLTKKEIAGFAAGMVDVFKSGNLAKGALSMVYNASLQVADAGSAFTAATGQAESYLKVIDDVQESYQHLGVGGMEAGAAATALYKSFSDFTTLGESSKATLAGQAAVLEKLNVSAASTGALFDTATKSLGFNATELVGLTQDLSDTAQSLGKTTEEVFADFASVSKQLAFYGKDVVDVFGQLEKQSKATGLTVDELVNISGKAFDTFDGAATKVGKLNAILGGPYLNSIDMLNASEADRIDMLKQSMDMAGQTFSELSKFEQLAIADAMGVDVDTARRMFGNLSAAEEMEIENQKKIAEVAAKSMKQLDKLKNAFLSVFNALEPLTSLIILVTDSLAALLTVGDGIPAKIVLWGLAIASGIYAIYTALTKLPGAAGSAAGAVQNAFTGMKDGLKSLKDKGLKESITDAFKKGMGGGEDDGAIPCPEACPEIEPPASPDASATSNWDSFTEGIKKLGDAVKDTWREMLAFGAAILMIGGGIAIAALGLSKLVESFQNLSGGQIAGALTALVIVGILFAGMLYILATASLTAVGPMLALGLAFLLIGGGIALAAFGMSLLVGSFAELKGGQILAAAVALIFFSAAMVGIVAAAVMSTAAAPAILAMAALLGAIGVAAILMGIGINIAAKGLTLMVEALVQIPPDQIFALAMAVGKLGISLITLGIGSVAAAAGLGILAIALALAAIPLTLGSYVLALFGNALMIVGTGMMLVASGMTIFVAQLLKIPAEEIADRALVVGDLGIKLIILGVGAGLAAAGLGILAAAVALTAIPLAIGSFGLKIFGAALMTVGLGMTMVAAGAGSLASSVMTFSDVLPQLREFTDALKGIGGSAFGILKTAAALTALTYSLGPFALALALLQLKKLEALTAFNQSATLTVKNVQKPAIPNEAIAATGAAMDNSSTPSKGGPTKPVINFSQKSIVVKIGEKELQDVFIEFLKHPEVANAISGMGN